MKPNWGEENIWCHRCKDHKLLNMDYWDINFSLHEFNTEASGQAIDRYIDRMFSRADCRGCNTLNRRRIKVLMILLGKLGVI